MQILTIDQIISNIKNKVIFEAVPHDRSFSIRIETYKPLICAAIHNGHSIRDELKEICLLDKQQRWYEEDPLTGDFITGFPVTLIANDSRYEYDLNRDPANCIYETAWGSQVWDRPLSAKERTTSLKKHENFYRVFHVLMEKLDLLFGSCVVYDIHSFNYKRYEHNTPVFNIGAEKVNLKKFGYYIRHWQKELSQIRLPNIETKAAINDVFKGNGYLLQYALDHFPESLVLATEIKKVYCDEKTGETYPVVIEALKEGLKEAILSNATRFVRNRTRFRPGSKAVLLNNHLEKSIIEVDRMLYKMVRNFEILNYVNPVNIEKEKKKFFNSGFNYHPQFRYKQLEIDPYTFRRTLYTIPIETIEDVGIRSLYRDVIDSYADKVDIIASIGKEKFLYNSLRYYGKPDESDLDNAHYLLYLPGSDMKEEDEGYTSSEALPFFRKAVEEYGFKCRIDLSNRIVAKAIVINHKRQLLIKKSATFTSQGINALINHEVGVHMLTTMNSLEQKLRLFNIGLPLNDLTQEGLAVLSEYLSGNMNLTRLKELALRVISVDHMLKGNDFVSTFHYLTDHHRLNPKRAFNLSARIFRGGGFTKDHLYLRGFKLLLKQFSEKNHISNLFIGKTSIAYLDIINELVDRKLVHAPKYLPASFTHQQANDPIVKYIISGIK